MSINVDSSVASAGFKSNSGVGNGQDIQQLKEQIKQLSKEVQKAKKLNDTKRIEQIQKQIQQLQERILKLESQKNTNEKIDTDKVSDKLVKNNKAEPELGNEVDVYV